MQHDAEPAPRDLPRRFRARESAADDVNRFPRHARDSRIACDSFPRQCGAVARRRLYCGKGESHGCKKKSSAASKKSGASTKGRGKVEKVMHEFKEGELKSGGRKKVTNPKQAIAIALERGAAVRRQDSQEGRGEEEGGEERRPAKK